MTLRWAQMIETTGATRHIYTAAAVAVRHEMTPDTLASRQYDTAVGQKGKKKEDVQWKKLHNNQPLVQVLFMLPFNASYDYCKCKWSQQQFDKEATNSQSVASLNILQTLESCCSYLSVGHFFILETIWEKRRSWDAAWGRSSQRSTRIDKDANEIINISLKLTTVY